MMKQYKVSICIPIYGVEKYIERCAKSLFEQTYPNIEYIFVNDCSKDNSIAILTKVIKQYSNRKPYIHIISHAHNRGLAAARNTAVAAASGDFLMHVDGDDYLEVDCVELCVKKQLETDTDIVSYGCYREYSSKTVIQNPPNFNDSKEMCLQLIKKINNGRVINVAVWGRMYKRSLYINNKITVEEGVNMAEDYQVVSKLAYYAKQIAIVNKPLIHYNLQNQGSYVNSISKSKCEQSRRSFQIVEDFFKDKGDDYVDALYIAKTYQITRLLIDSIKGGLGKNYFVDLTSDLKNIPSRYFGVVSVPYRIILMLPYYTIAKLYLKLISLLK